MHNTLMTCKMKRNQLPYYSIFILVVLSVVSFQTLCFARTLTSLATDELTLLALKANIVSDPSGIITGNWTRSTSVCSWIGVDCSLRHQRVAVLNISNMGITGTIPPNLGNLSFLVSLDLSRNNFVGVIPMELSRLRRLKLFAVNINSLSGEMPLWFSLLTELENLKLNNNNFTSFVPSSISNLSNLEYLYLSNNPLGGTIPKELGNLPRLRILVMEGNHLTGPIPLSIFNLSTLQIMSFSDNDLIGNLPTNMCRNLPFLEFISLSTNMLSGPIPSNLSQCSQLRIISLSSNHFSGQIPRQIGMLKNLEVLYLGGNNLEGTIPKNIGNLTMLTQLDLCKNRLTGVIPEEIGQLYKLNIFLMKYNSLTGSIPSELFNISTLQQVTLYSNGLEGSLPASIGHNLPFLEEIYLGMNNFTGSIPYSISNCSQLRILALGENKFTGPVPSSLGNLRLLERLYLGDNNLRTESSSLGLDFITSLTNCESLKHVVFGNNPDIEGVIPVSIGNLSTSLEMFHSGLCNIKGGIPAEISKLRNLVTLDLSYNTLTGSIPIGIQRLHKLQGLNLANNKMSGLIPEGLCNLLNLVVIDMGRNRFSGPIPECLGNVTTLRNISLESNLLTSSIPVSIWCLQDLLKLDLSSNSLTGLLSPRISNLVSTIDINLSTNQFSGQIPSTIGKLQSLEALSLGHNKLQGSIPDAMGSMINLQTLDLSHNNLSGSIPMSLQALKYLTNLDLTFNALTGEIPTDGPFQNITSESFKGNKGLCGNERFDVRACPTGLKHGLRLKRVYWTFLILSFVVVFIIAFSLAYIFIRRFRRKYTKMSRLGNLHMDIIGRMSYYELLQATDHFHESNLVGVGSIGSVYKGTFREGKFFAIKVFNLQLEAAFESFVVECEVLRSIRHRNLTKIFNSCSNEDFKALILEFMPNGSLEKWLYSHNFCLDTMQRLNIMIDVASALEYLHGGYSTPIVHCDVKPSNVLLDENMVGHVSDFGIAKMLGEGCSVTITNTLATLGYIAPEYGIEGFVSTKCDVYSYGIMLMETFTRKRPCDEMFGVDLSLRSWVKGLLPTSANQVIDVNLLNNDEKNIDKIMHCATSILELGLRCSADSPRERMLMKDALAELQKIKRHLV